MKPSLSAAVIGFLVVLACLAAPVSTSAGGAAVARAASADPTIAAAGDIGCGPSDPNYNGGNGTATACRMKYTSDLLVNGGYSAVLALGDTMQSDPSPTGYATVFAPTWGRVKALIHPILGNHEYGYSGAQGYFGYFGAARRRSVQGVLQLRPRRVAHRRAEQQLREDRGRVRLRRRPGRVAARRSRRAPRAMHPGDRAPPALLERSRAATDTFMIPLFQDLLNAHADVLLSGHSHDYERFEPQDNASHLDTAGGITQFVVGTGGAFFTGLGTRHANSVTSQNSTFGVLALTLHPTGYDWRFVPEAGKTWTDSGSAELPRRHVRPRPTTSRWVSARPPRAFARAARRPRRCRRR